MKRNVCRLLFTLCLVVSALVTTAAAAAWNGTDIASGFTGGDGSEDDPYQISTGADLAYLAQEVNDGTSYRTYFFVLQDDINLGNQEWTPIGDNNKLFSGTFDGAEYTISGLNVITPNSDGTHTYAGLFGYVSSSGTVQNVTVNGTIDVTIASAAPTGSVMYAGGVVGYVDIGCVKNCISNVALDINTGSYTSGVCVGGLVGENHDATVQNCYATGDVSATATGYTCVGGVVGHNYQSIDGIVQNCYATGDVSGNGTTYVGGVVGSNEGTVSDYFVSDCYWKSNATNGIGSGTSTNVVKFTDAGTVSGTLSDGTTTYNTLLGALNAWVGTQAGYYNWKQDNAAECPVFNALLTNTSWAGQASAAVEYTDYEVDGDDYTIITPKGLAYFASLVNDNTTDINATLEDNIDLAGGEWTPIGDATKRYTGTFDGAGYTISNMTVSGDKAAAGLFGYVGVGGTVKNMTVSGGSINATTTEIVCAGGIAGASSGTVENCATDISVTATATADYMNAYAGGVVGKIYTDSSVKNCYATGDVSANAEKVTTATAGGVVGESYCGTVQNCYATGIVTATLTEGTSTYIGGVVGNNASGTVSDCYYLDTCAETGIDSDNGTVTNVVSFTGTGAFDPSVTVNETSCDTLLDALNAWVTAQNSTDYCNWVGDDSLPTFTPVTFTNVNYVTVDETLTLTTAKFGTGEVRYSVDDATIATVGETTGILTAGSTPGMVKVTATLGGESVDMTIFVVADGVTVTTVPDTDITIYLKPATIVKVDASEDEKTTWETDWAADIPAGATTEKAFHLYALQEGVVQASPSFTSQTIEISQIIDTSKEYQILHKLDGGSIVPVTSTVDAENNKLSFIVDSLSPFMVISTPAPTSSGGGTPSSYSSSVATADNGSVTLSSTKSKLGTTVTITPKADAGYEVSDVTVTYASGREVTVTKSTNGTYTYNQPGASVTVNVTFTKIGGEPEPELEPQPGFADVNETAYCFDAVNWALAQGITAGKTETTFAPNDINTRGEAVTFLYRAMGQPAHSAGNPFTDVSADSFYEDAVLWAMENGITTGTADATFAPYAHCTRGQIITFLWRAMGEPVVNYAMTFSDVAQDDWCAEAIRWAVSEGITTGTGDGSTFSPNATCTRGQIVTFLFRAMGE